MHVYTVHAYQLLRCRLLAIQRLNGLFLSVMCELKHFNVFSIIHFCCFNLNLHLATSVHRVCVSYCAFYPHSTVALTLLTI